jgi:hypothetical protein
MSVQPASASATLRRTIGPQRKFHSEELTPGVRLERYHPGGKEGPNREVHNDIPGGQTWSETVLLGETTDAFQLMIPDIRMPANQFWPLHWHDCWTAVVVLEGKCVIGDWYMQPGDVFIAEPSIEYGPLLIGPHGCRVLEVFAQGHLAPGGYSPEYRDHPTLQGGDRVFKERSAVNKRNEGHSVLPLAGKKEFVTGRLEPGAIWDLGNKKDPDRGIIADTRLAPGEKVAKHCYGDWHGILTLDGSLEIDGRKVERDGFLLIKPDSPVSQITAGPKGAQLLEFARTSRGLNRQSVA